MVERLQELSTPDGELSFDERLVPGDRVRIAGGPFDALCGILERAGEADRVTILLEILSRKTRVEMDRGRLIAA